MERIREHLKKFDGEQIDFQKFIYSCDSKWGQLETGLPFDMDLGAQLVMEYINQRNGANYVPVELPVILTAEEAKDIARVLGVDESAESIKEAICTAAVSAIALKEAPIKG